MAKRSTASVKSSNKRVKQDTSVSDIFDLDFSHINVDHCEDMPSQPIESFVPDPFSYKPGEANFSGFKCRFLRSPIRLVLFSSSMCITRNSSVAVFTLPRIMRRRLIQNVEELLNTATPIDVDLDRVNPFKSCPVFLRIPGDAKLFELKDDETSIIQKNKDVGPITFDELKGSKRFKGRVAVEMLGYKFNNVKLFPMLRVSEVFKIETMKEETLPCCTITLPTTDEWDIEDDGTSLN